MGKMEKSSHVESLASGTRLEPLRASFVLEFEMTSELDRKYAAHGQAKGPRAR